MDTDDCTVDGNLFQYLTTLLEKKCALVLEIGPVTGGIIKLLPL